MTAAHSDQFAPRGWSARTVLGRPVLVEEPATGSPTPGGPADRAVVAGEPVAVRSANGPVLSLVVLLERQPPPENPSVVPLIVSSTLSMDVQVGVDDDVLALLAAESSDRCQRLYVDRVDYRLGRPISIVYEPALAESTAQGTIGRAALSASLGRDDTLAVMGALRGDPSSLEVQAVISCSRPGPTRVLRLHASWADIWDALRDNAGGVITAGTLRLAVVDLLADGRLTAEAAAEPAESTGVSSELGNPDRDERATDQDAVDVSPVDISPDEIARIVGMQAAVVLDRSDPLSWRLRNRPHPAIPFDYESRVAGRMTSAFTVSAPLHRLLGEPLTGLSLEPYISLVAPRPDVDVQPVGPRRVRRNQRSDRDGGASPVLAWNSGLLTSVAAFAEPRRVSNASAAFLASAASRPEIALRPEVTHLPLDNVAVFDQADRGEQLPVVEDPAAVVWVDRLDGGLRWYAPQVELVLPAPSTQAAASPFSFRFRRTGITDNSRPALEATITLALRRVPPPGADAAAAGALLRQVPLQGVAVALEVPFIDGNDGTAKHQVLDGVVTPTDDGWSVQVRVVNDWVRICYRALSGADPAAEPGVLRLDYSLSGYTPMRRGNWEVALRPSIATLPVQYVTRAVEIDSPDPVFDARTLTLQTAAANIVFRRENVAALAGVGLTRAFPSTPAWATRAVVKEGAVGLRPFQDGGVIFERPVVINKPVVRPVDVSVQADEITYAKRTFARRVTVAARVPCASYGGLYLETLAEGDVAVGCRNELQLGETRYAVFRELADLGSADYRVHQLLQQPGRFLVAPSRYGITRHDSDEGNLAYRPCVVLYAVLDPDQADNNRVQLDATLQPAVGADQWQELQARLRDLDPTPQLLLPTEVEGVSATFDWAVPGSGPQATTTVLTGGLLRVGISCSIPDWLVIRAQLHSSSLSGTAEFHYPDGTMLRAELMLDLTQVLGPWESGPVQVALTGTGAVLTNRTERTVDVVELLCATASGRARVPVATSLPGSGTATVTVPADTVNAVPAVSLPRTDPVQIEESRSFVDSLETNVVFVNLVALAARGLARLSIAARIQGFTDERTAAVTDAAPTAELHFILSLTSYLTVRALEYRITITAADGTATTGNWSTWDLAGQGNVISLTWGHLGAASETEQGGQSA